MYIKLKEIATPKDVASLKKKIKDLKLGTIEVHTENHYNLGIIGDKTNLNLEKLNGNEIIDELVTLKVPYKFVSREFKSEDTIIEIGNVKIGGGHFATMAGPCSVENLDMIMESAKVIKEGKGQFLRGGAFKPRTSPYDFQGLEEEGLKYLRKAGDKYDLLVVTEVMDASQIELISKYADMLQVGARNMQNFTLLKELGKIDKPILLKRGMSATVQDLLMAAEYIAASGNLKIVLCERGIRTFETMTRNTVDINSIPLIKELSHLPMIIDASHGTGKRSLVEPITLAGVVAGADGAMVEIHPKPSQAYSDGEQSLELDGYLKLMKKIEKIRSVLAD